MLTVAFRFPGRRYHATPTGHHVNEGMVEWPPSPWRLLRAMLATGYTKLGWTSVPPDGRSLIEKLARVLPEYWLPPACAGHSRHYMPLARFKNAREDTSLVFDTWADVGDGELFVSWDVDLSDQEREIARCLVRDLGYLGRSESWVDGRVAELEVPPSTCAHATPSEATDRPGPEWEQVALLAPEPAESYRSWREAQIESLAETKPKGKKKASKKRSSANDAFPENLLDCLQVETSWLEANGWNQPPGSRRALYWRPRNAIEPGAPPIRTVPAAPRRAEAMLLALASPSGNMHALPSISRTLPQAELFHRALVSHVVRLCSGNHSLVSGHDDEGKLELGHQHIHILPLDLDGDRHIDHLLLWAPAGLDADAQRAARCIRKTYAKGMGELRVGFGGVGDLDDFRKLPGPIGTALRSALGPIAGARVWLTETPFVPPRYPKPRGRNTIVGQIVSELVSRALPSNVEVTVLSHSAEPAIPLRHFVRVRRQGPAPPVDVGFAIRLEFPSPLHGPLCLGYGSHFGLGRFSASTDPVQQHSLQQ